jgi:hypothetical protein
MVRKGEKRRSGGDEEVRRERSGSTEWREGKERPGRRRVVVSRSGVRSK